MKLFLLFVSLLNASAFAATTITATDENLKITKLQKLSDSSMNWYFNWGVSLGLDKGGEYCNSTETNVDKCNTNAIDGFRIDKDTVCRVSLEKLEEKQKNGKLVMIAEVATVECESGDRSFQLNDYICNHKSGGESQSFTFSKNKKVIGQFGISCARRITPTKR